MKQAGVAERDRSPGSFAFHVGSCAGTETKERGKRSPFELGFFKPLDGSPTVGPSIEIHRKPSFPARESVVERVGEAHARRPAEAPDEHVGPAVRKGALTCSVGDGHFQSI